MVSTMWMSAVVTLPWTWFLSISAVEFCLLSARTKIIIDYTNHSWYFNKLVLFNSESLLNVFGLWPKLKRLKKSWRYCWSVNSIIPSSLIHACVPLCVLFFERTLVVSTLGEERRHTFPRCIIIIKMLCHAMWQCFQSSSRRLPYNTYHVPLITWSMASVFRYVALDPSQTHTQLLIHTQQSTPALDMNASTFDILPILFSLVNHKIFQYLNMNK